MCEPISCVVSAQTRHVHLYKDGPKAPRVPKLGIKERGCCVVVGSGSMGKIHIELAMRYRPAHLIAVDPIQANLDWVRRALGEKARDRGIELAAVGPDHAREEIERRSNGKMADDVIIAVGIRKVQNEALTWLGLGGVADFFGGLKKGDSLLEIDNIRVHYDEIKVAGSSGGDPHDYLETLDAIVQKDIDPGNYIAGVGSLENAVKVLKMIQNNEVQGKVILYPHIRERELELVDYWDGNKERKYLEQNL
jgi:threonine dehydrogenase-like Zn-dependent dehydrogenase